MNYKTVEASENVVNFARQRVTDFFKYGTPFLQPFVFVPFDRGVGTIPKYNPFYTIDNQKGALTVLETANCNY